MREGSKDVKLSDYSDAAPRQVLCLGTDKRRLDSEVRIQFLSNPGHGDTISTAKLTKYY